MARAKFIIESLNDAGIQEILKSEEVKAMVEQKGAQLLGVANSSGRNYEMDTQEGRYRSITRIKPSDAAARRSNLKNNTLIKALYGGS